MNDNLFSSNAVDASKSIFADMILFFLTIFLVWELIKISLTSGSGPIQDVMKPLTKFIEDYAKTTPLIGWKSINQMQMTSKQVTGKYAEWVFGMDPTSRKSWRFTKAESDFKKKSGIKIMIVRLLDSREFPYIRQRYREW